MDLMFFPEHTATDSASVLAFSPVHYRARHFLPYCMSELVREDDVELLRFVKCAAIRCKAHPEILKCATAS
jgi:hypothetical protein